MASEVYIFGSWQGPRKQDLRLFWSGIHPAPMSPADFLNPILKLSTCKIPRDRRQGQAASIILDAMQPASSHRHFQIEQSAFAATDFRTFRDANWLNNPKLEMPQLTRTNSERRGME
ncbi:hypothetical protein GX48_01269 [Paracoccidioides brasiliensis]|nr:hypothetical protein GX48_01269 [Paracoccidioides brasiliensis]